jgi:hypothetical protein
MELLSYKGYILLIAALFLFICILSSVFLEFSLEFSEEKSDLLLNESDFFLNESEPYFFVHQDLTYQPSITNCSEAENYSNYKDFDYDIYLNDVFGCVLKEFYILDNNQTETILDKYHVTVFYEQFDVNFSGNKKNGIFVMGEE